ncbi:MAG: Zn-finger nucleic acid-binding protein [Planctomycetota bacterium]|jgi:Zn-finger nucleic acid-binding protein
MLIACETCHRQYDVAGQEVGARVRCFCGTLNKVPSPRARQVKMQHCSNCGGAIVGEAKSCGYCEAKITLGERGWGDSCPECMARMVKGAKFCGACGIAIRVQAALQPLVDQACPRCQHNLSICSDNEHAFAECTGCGGVWLTAKVFRELLEDRQRFSVADIALPRRAEKPDALPSLERHPVKYLSCPVCEVRMNRKNFARLSGIMIDFCAEHGHWFDMHELEHIQRFVADGGLDRARSHESESDRMRLKRLTRANVRSKSPMSSGPMSSGGGVFTPRSQFFVWDLVVGLLCSFVD